MSSTPKRRSTKDRRKSTKVSQKEDDDDISVDSVASSVSRRRRSSRIMSVQNSVEIKDNISVETSKTSKTSKSSKQRRQSKRKKRAIEEDSDAYTSPTKKARKGVSKTPVNDRSFSPSKSPSPGPKTRSQGPAEKVPRKAFKSAKDPKKKLENLIRGADTLSDIEPIARKTRSRNTKK